MNPSTQSQVNNLSAALVSDVRFVEFKTALYESIGKKSYNDASEAYGAIKGQIHAFEQIEEWAVQGVASKLQEAQPKQGDLPEPPKYADPDLER